MPAPGRFYTILELHTKSVISKLCASWRSLLQTWVQYILRALGSLWNLQGFENWAWKLHSQGSVCSLPQARTCFPCPWTESVHLNQWWAAVRSDPLSVLCLQHGFVPASESHSFPSSCLQHMSLNS